MGDPLPVQEVRVQHYSLNEDEGSVQVDALGLLIADDCLFQALSFCDFTSMMSMRCVSTRLRSLAEDGIRMIAQPRVMERVSISPSTSRSKSTRPRPRDGVRQRIQALEPLVVSSHNADAVGDEIYHSEEVRIQAGWTFESCSCSDNSSDIESTSNKDYLIHTAALKYTNPGLFVSLSGDGHGHDRDQVNAQYVVFNRSRAIESLQTHNFVNVNHFILDADGNYPPLDAAAPLDDTFMLGWEVRFQYHQSINSIREAWNIISSVMLDEINVHRINMNMKSSASRSVARSVSIMSDLKCAIVCLLMNAQPSSIHMSMVSYDYHCHDSPAGGKQCYLSFLTLQGERVEVVGGSHFTVPGFNTAAAIPS